MPPSAILPGLMTIVVSPGRPTGGGTRARALSLVVLVVLMALAPLWAAAQAPRERLPMPAGVFVGSDLERYLRVLQTLGLVRLYPWSIRGFSQGELDALRPVTDEHPWATHPAFAVPPRTDNRPEIIPAEFSASYNTAFPFGMNDGPVWAGRGVTAAGQAGVAFRRGALSIVAAPILFWAENRSFALLSNGHSGNLQFADPLYPTLVDRPQRFGDGPYSRLDPGQTTIRVDRFGATAAFSTANEWWGPMTEFPFLLGNNAPGFSHVFVGTGTPANVWIGRLHFRVMYGGLSQSSYTDIAGRERGRLASAVIAVFTPRGAPGLELGAARFFHTFWPDSGVGSRQLRKPFESLLKLALPDNDPDRGSENQLASLFGRWVLPQNGFEVYGEYGREDHNGDTRDLLQEPDHIATYGLGLQKAWAPRGGPILVVRGELMNFETSTLARHRPEGAVYFHTGTRQGHTHRGQLLGAGFAVGSGAGSTVRLERYTNHGSESIAWSRLVRQESDNAQASSTLCSDACLDVQHVLRLDRARLYGRLEIRYGLTFTYEFNRDFARDAVNWTPELKLRWYP
jgi:hypothetical protein